MKELAARIAELTRTIAELEEELRDTRGQVKELRERKDLLVAELLEAVYAA